MYSAFLYAESLFYVYKNVFLLGNVIHVCVELGSLLKRARERETDKR